MNSVVIRFGMKKCKINIIAPALPYLEVIHVDSIAKNGTDEVIDFLVSIFLSEF